MMRSLSMSFTKLIQFLSQKNTSSSPSFIMNFSMLPSSLENKYYTRFGRIPRRSSSYLYVSLHRQAMLSVRSIALSTAISCYKSFFSYCITTFSSLPMISQHHLFKQLQRCHTSPFQAQK